MSRKDPLTAIGTTVSLDFEEVYGCEGLQSEQRLLIAVVQRALYDYAFPQKGKAHHQFDAAFWLFNNEAHGPMSLHWICEHLSDHPEALKRTIRLAARQKNFRNNAVIFRVDRR